MKILHASNIALALFFITVAAAIAACYPPSAPSAQKPGPSATLFASPYYTCVTNRYVSTAGSDSNSGVDYAHAWLTLQHANDTIPGGGGAAGYCVNVDPGTYPVGVAITHGGNLASSTGYVVYRCLTMDGCNITGPSADTYGAFASRGQGGDNYVIIDGFNLAAASAGAYQQGVEVYIYPPSNAWPASGSAVNHHIWVLNSIISGWGQSGLQMNQGEYFYALHNKIYNNSTATCDAQGSGISFATPIAVTGYSRTADDANNPMIGNIGTTANIVAEWNIVYNNALTSCGSATDGNGIIADTWSWNGISGSTPYTKGGLFAFNVVYNNGGGGIVAQWAEYLTVANNSVYNNYLDTHNSGTARGGIILANTYSSVGINNLSVGVPTAGACTNSSPYTQYNNALTTYAPTTIPGGGVHNTWSNNVTQIQGSYTGCNADVATANGDTYSSSANKQTTSPGWTAVGNISTGSETSQPSGVNFALQAGSQAIGYGLTETYLPATSVDAGACASALTTCP